MRTFSIIIALLFVGFTSNAQSLATLDGSGVSANKSFSFDLEDWSIFHNQEDNLFYVDLAAIEANLSDIKVTDEQGKVIYQENLDDLPVDAIYELDLSTYATGNYQVEVRTFKDSVVRSVSVK